MRRKVAFAILLLSAVSAFAQTARVGGRITDAQGGILPGATVTMTQVDTRLSSETVTNASGSYHFPALDPGAYHFEIRLAGFASWTRRDIVLTVGQGITLDATLELAGLSEAITVTGETPMISNRESKVGGVVESEQIENIPINSRDVQQLALLVPGAKRANSFDPTKSIVPAISFGTNGSGRGILYTLDGGDNTDDVVGGIVQQVSMDSIQEFEVTTSRIKAEHSRAGGGVISMVTKSGTNAFHGSAFELFRDRSLNAETEPEKIEGEGKAPFRRHQLGAVLGGPIVRDRAFFFVSYERVVEDVNTILSVPADIEALYDPAFVEAHGGFGKIDQPFRRNYFTAKVTQQLGEGNRLDVRYAYEDNSRAGDQVGAGQSRDQEAVQTNDLWSVLARGQTLFSSSGLNELVFQASDFRNAIVSVLQDDFHAPGGPSLYFPSASVGQNGSAPQSTYQRKYQFRDTFSYSLATHDLKFGGEALHGSPFGFDVPFGNQGSFAYANDGDATDQAIFFSQLDLAPPMEVPYTAFGFFVQDDFRLHESLTLNLGIRYDVEIGTLSNVPYGEIGNLVTSDPRSPYAGLGPLEDDKNNWAPRLGFAWDVGSREQTVVRGGWGLFYDKIVANTTLFTLLDAADLRGVSIENPGFGPESIPPFEELYATAGLGIPVGTVVVPGFQIPKTEQLTLGVSHQLAPTLALDIDYVRSRADERGKVADINERSIPEEDSSRPFYPEFESGLTVIEPRGFDRYDGLQLSLRKRFTGRIQLTANYTVGSLRGNAVSGFGNPAECYACAGDDRDVGPLGNDTLHNFITGGIVALPAGFQASALLQAESGRPLTARSSEDLDGNGNFVDFTEGPEGEPPGRGNFRGDPTITLDLRVTKFFPMGRERNLQITFEAFNLFNRVNRGQNFTDTFESPNFGKWTQGLETNQLQVQLGVRFQF